MSSRRTFLKSSAGFAAALTSRSFASTKEPDTRPLPKVRFGKYEVSRLIMGCNQFYGYSHFNNLLDEHMREWNTQDRVCQTLRQCEQQGINGYQYAYVEGNRSLSDLECYRSNGGNMQLIAVHLGKSPVEQVVSRIQPIALYRRRWKARASEHSVVERRRAGLASGTLVGRGNGPLGKNYSQC